MYKEPKPFTLKNKSDLICIDSHRMEHDKLLLKNQVIFEENKNDIFFDNQFESSQNGSEIKLSDKFTKSVILTKSISKTCKRTLSFKK